MNVGLVDVDGHHYPNLALMKIAAYHKSQGDSVEWADPMFGHYDVVYMSKIFAFTPGNFDYYDCEVIKGGTGYDINSRLPSEIERQQPDYSIYPFVDDKTAYGFLTRGCPNRCPWCIVPQKEGKIAPYNDVEEIAVDGRHNLILMDNNILASDYGIGQIEKIVRKRLRVDFNQGLDARLVTPEIAQLLSKVRWLDFIRFGCDTPRQVVECERAMALIDSFGKPRQYLLYTIISEDFEESFDRINHFRDNKRVRVQAQPFRNFNSPFQIIPDWQRDLAHWANKRQLYKSCEFRDFSPRKDFKCIEYFR